MSDTQRTTAGAPVRQSRRAALATFGGAMVAVALAPAPVAAEAITPAAPLYKLRHARPDEFEAVRVAAIGFTKQISAAHRLADEIAEETGQDRARLFDRLGAYAVRVEHHDAVPQHGEEAGAH